MAVAEITRSETAERARLLTVEGYDVALDLTRGDKTFRSACVITFGCAEPGAGSYADLAAETVHEIRLNGQALDPAAACRDGRIALTGLASRNELRVVADFAYTSDGSALHRCADSADGRVYLYTTLFPAEGRRVFATFEQPDLKAAFSFHVTAPAHWTVLSNQPAPAPEPAGDGAAVWHFAPTPRISTYLAVIVAGEYHLVTGSHTTPAGQVIPLGLACRQSLARYLEPDDIFGYTRQGLDFYTGLFGGPFPFAKYDQVMVPEFPAGAMENVACVTFTERQVFRSRVTDAAYEQRASVILHEMAHMWFGNLVTMKWFDDLWLNESFADYCAALSSAEATRFTSAWTTFCAGRKTWGYQQDQLPSTHPIAADVPTLTQAIANFDGISYAKGASVLKQLVAYLGRDNFFAGIRAYLTGNSWGNATLADLLRCLEASSGRDVTGWSRAWLETAGPNTLRPGFTVAADGSFAEFAVLQEAPAEHPTLRPHHVAIGLYNRAANGALMRTQRAELDIAGRRTVVPELTGLAQPDLVLLNDDDLGYAIIRLDERSMRTLTTSIGQLEDSLARTLCWSAVLDMATQAEISAPVLVAAVVAGMGSETSISVLQSVLAASRELLATTADPDWLPEGLEQLASAATGLLQAAGPGSDWQLAWAQLLGWTAVTPDQLGLVAGLLDGGTAIPGLTIDTELRWTLLRRLTVTGQAEDSQIDAELARDATDSGRRHAVACRAAIGDAGHKEAAWQLMTGPGELGVETAVEVGRAFNSAEHARLLAAFADRYLDALPHIWASRESVLRLTLGKALFPYPAASPELLGRLDAFLSTGNLDPGLARVVVEGRDIAEKALRARALPA